MNSINPVRTPRNRAGAVVGVDLGGTKIAAGLVEGSAVFCREVAATPAQEGPEAILRVVSDVVGRVVERYRDSGGSALVGCVGIGTAGVIDEADGVVVSATSHLAGWGGTRLSEEVTARTGFRAFCLNDVHAHALGEHIFGAGRGHDSSLLVAAGTGLGGSLVVGGRPLFGAHHLAGHFGHVPCAEAAGLSCSCGGAGHLECLASGAGLLAAYRAAGGSLSSSREIANAAERGDASAAVWLSRSGGALGRSIGGWVNALDPGVVILAGGLSRSGQTWWDAMAETARSEALDPGQLTIVAAQRGDDAAVLGAAEFARSRHTEENEGRP